jgi:hypothetical protein
LPALCADATPPEADPPKSATLTATQPNHRMRISPRINRANICLKLQLKVEVVNSR